MIFCSAILLMALFFTIFFSMQLMDGIGDSFKENLTGKITYATIERNVTNGAMQYMDKYYDNELSSGTVTILTDNLIKYGILKEDDFITYEKDTCTGYALIRKNKENKLYSEPFIKCNNYLSKEFQNWRIGE